jgi:hypothetical protein
MDVRNAKSNHSLPLISHSHTQTHPKLAKNVSQEPSQTSHNKEYVICALLVHTQILLENHSVIFVPKIHILPTELCSANLVLWVQVPILLAVPLALAVVLEHFII